MGWYGIGMRSCEASPRSLPLPSHPRHPVAIPVLDIYWYSFIPRTAPMSPHSTEPARPSGFILRERQKRRY